MKERIKEISPASDPKTITKELKFLQNWLSWSRNSLWYIITGIIKARAVQAKAPVKLMKSPNLGIIMAEYPDAMTMRVLRTSELTHLSLSPNMLGNFSNPLL